MKNIAKFVLISIIFALFLIGVPYKNEANSASCYYPFQRIDLEEVYNGSVCQGYFQVYYFPVITDGRKYTITLHSIKGRQMLYASRYKNEVDELSDLQSWLCDDDHCDSSVKIDEKTKIVNFYSPQNEPAYYSWFAVYGTDASEYQIGVSNGGVFQFKTTGNFEPAPQVTNATSVKSTGSVPVISWKTLNTETNLNLSDTSWTSAGFNDGAWKNETLPKRSGWDCDNCYKRFRGTFELGEIAQDLKLGFASDDGIWVYINGQFMGNWGGTSPANLLCVNQGGCANNINVPDIKMNNLVQGKNVISLVVYDGGGGEYVSAWIKR